MSYKVEIGWPNTISDKKVMIIENLTTGVCEKIITFSWGFTFQQFDQFEDVTDQKKQLKQPE